MPCPRRVDTLAFACYLVRFGKIRPWSALPESAQLRTPVQSPWRSTPYPCNSPPVDIPSQRGSGWRKKLRDQCRRTNGCLSSTCFRWHLGESGSRSSRDSIYVAIRCFTPGWGLRHSSWDIHPSGPHTRASDRRLFRGLRWSGMTQLRTRGPCEAPGRNQATEPLSPGGVRGRDLPACAPRRRKAALRYTPPPREPRGAVRRIPADATDHLQPRIPSSGAPHDD